MALRYFYEENREIHVIAAGSLMEFALKDISFPVGRVRMIQMHPMSFEEYLVANDKALLAEKIKLPEIQLSDTVIRMVNNELYNYFIVSGKSGSLKSLHLLLESFLNIKTAYVFTENKYGELPEKGIKFFPLFKAASIINRNTDHI